MKAKQLNFKINDYILFADEDGNLFGEKTEKLRPLLKKIRKTVGDLSDASDEDYFMLNRVVYDKQKNVYEIEETILIEMKVNTLIEVVTTSFTSMDELSERIAKKKLLVS